MAREPKAVTSLADLTPDPANARRHTPRNVSQIESAIGEVGAARSIVIDENGTVLAGNATIEAAARLGIDRVQVVDADGETIIAVRRSGLTAKQKTRLALFDNRAAETAEWDEGVLAELAALDGGEALAGLWTDAELAAILGGGLVDDDPLDGSEQLGAYEYRVIVACNDEAHQMEVIGALENMGLICQALIS